MKILNCPDRHMVWLKQEKLIFIWNRSSELHDKLEWKFVCPGFITVLKLWKSCCCISITLQKSRTLVLFSSLVSSRLPCTDCLSALSCSVSVFLSCRRLSLWYLASMIPTFTSSSWLNHFCKQPLTYMTMTNVSVQECYYLVIINCRGVWDFWC